MMPDLPKSIAANIANFTGRTWLLSPLLTWLEQTNERMFILCGEPGSGKSSLMAWLAGTGPSPVEAQTNTQLEQIRGMVRAAHFCIFASGNIAPKAFAQNMAEQLTRSVAGFSDALATILADRVQVSVEQHIGQVSTGSVTGIHIGNLNLSDLGDELSFNHLLREPLRRLYTGGYNQPILLLVDGLDEAATYTGSTTLVRLLARLIDLPEQVRLLMTTRADPRVLKHYQRFKTLDLIRDVPPGVDDIKAHAYERLSPLNEKDRLNLARRISQAAEGNFLYTHLILDDLLAHLPDISDPASLVLPKGLGGLYHEFLNRELGVDENRWFAIFKPFLGLIAVAQGEGLSRNQLERITEQELEQALRVCKQYLDGNLPDGPFRLFHKSFADFLLEDQSNIDYHLDAIAMHRRLTGYYLDIYSKNWQRCDEYGLTYLVQHLAAGQQLEDLYTLIESQAWTVAKYVDTPWTNSLVRDLQLASTLAADGSIADWARAIGYQLRRALVEWLMSTLSDRAILLMARLGQVERALEFAKRHTWRRFDLIRNLARIIAPTQPAKAITILVNELAQLADGESILNQCIVKLATAEEILRLFPSFSPEPQKLIEEVHELEKAIPETDQTTYRIEWALPVLALSSQLEIAIEAAGDLSLFQQAQAMRHISLALSGEDQSNKRRLAELALQTLEGLDHSPESAQEKMRVIVTLLPLVNSERQAVLLDSLEAAGNYLQSIEAPDNYYWIQSWVIDRVANVNLVWAKRMLLESNWRGAQDNDGHEVIVANAKVNLEEALQLFEEFAVWAGSSQTLADIIGLVACDDTDKAEALINQYAERLGRDKPEAYIALAEGYLTQGNNQKAQEILEQQIFPIKRTEGVIHSRSDLKLAILKRAGTFVSVEEVSNRLMEFPVCPHCHSSEKQEAKTILACIAARQNRVDFLETCHLTQKAQVAAAYYLIDFVGPETARAYLERHHIPEWSKEGKEIYAHIATKEAQQDPTKLEVLLAHFKGDKGPHHLCAYMTKIPFALQELVETKRIDPNEALVVIEQIYSLMIDWQCPDGDNPPRANLTAGRCFCYSRREDLLARLIGVMAQIDSARAEQLVESLPDQPVKVYALAQILYQTQADMARVHSIIEASQKRVEDPWQRAEIFYNLATSLPTEMSDTISHLIQLAEPLLTESPTQYYTDEFGVPFRIGPSKIELKICKAQALMKLVSNLNQFATVTKSLEVIKDLAQLDDKLRVFDILVRQVDGWSKADKLALLWRIWEVSINRNLVDVQTFIAFSIHLVKSIAGEDAFWRLYNYVEWAYQDLLQVDQNKT